jgi:hypothetical protein
MAVVKLIRQNKLKCRDIMNITASVFVYVNVMFTIRICIPKLRTPWPVVLKQTIMTERPPLVGEVSANFSG